MHAYTRGGIAIMCSAKISRAEHIIAVPPVCVSVRERRACVLTIVEIRGILVAYEFV